jgi:putative colanic acid biosynthesis acetyltransferase WcaF
MQINVNKCKKGGQKDLYYKSEYIPKRLKIKLHLWSIVQQYLVCTSPKVFSKWRIMWLRLFGAHIGKGCFIAPSVYVLKPWEIKIGNFCSIDEGCYLHGYLDIGHYVSIGNHTHIETGSHDVCSRYFDFLYEKVIIDSGTFIGGDVYIGRGVHIGQFAVVGAKSVVWHDIPENTIAFGIPCIVKSERIPQDEYLKYRYE